MRKSTSEVSNAPKCFVVLYRICSKQGLWPLENLVLGSAPCFFAVGSLCDLGVLQGGSTLLEKNPLFLQTEAP